MDDDTKKQYNDAARAAVEKNKKEHGDDALKRDTSRSKMKKKEKSETKKQSSNDGGNGANDDSRTSDPAANLPSGWTTDSNKEEPKKETDTMETIRQPNSACRSYAYMMFACDIRPRIMKDYPELKMEELVSLCVDCICLLFWTMIGV